MRSSTGAAPWGIIEGGDLRYSSLEVANAVLDGIQKHLQKRKKLKEVAAEMTDLKAEELDRLLDPRKMTEGGIAE